MVRRPRAERKVSAGRDGGCGARPDMAERGDDCARRRADLDRLRRAAPRIEPPQRPVAAGDPDDPVLVDRDRARAGPDGERVVDAGGRRRDAPETRAVVCDEPRRVLPECDRRRARVHDAVDEGAAQLAARGGIELRDAVDATEPDRTVADGDRRRRAVPLRQWLWSAGLRVDSRHLAATTLERPHRALAYRQHDGLAEDG